MVLWLCCVCVLMGLRISVFFGPVCHQNLICGILELWSFFFAADRFSFSAVVCCRRRCPKVAFLFVVVIVDSWCIIVSPLWRVNCGFGSFVFPQSEEKGVGVADVDFLFSCGSNGLHNC